jgi:2-phospho-L-lactate guanylyltransferase
MAAHTVETLRASEQVSAIALVTSDGYLAQRLATEHVADPGDLNSGLAAAAGWAVSVGADSLLIVPADLPLLSVGAIRVLVRAGRKSRSAAIAGTRDGGTGALLLSPPDILEPSFGPQSYGRHIEQAHRRRIPIVEVRHESLTHDLDTPDDLRELSAVVRSLKRTLPDPVP